MRRFGYASLILLVAGLGSGCFRSSEPIGSTGEKKKDSQGAATAEAPDNGAEEAEGKWVGYEKLPYVPVADEAAGLKIPRTYKAPGDYVAGRAVPVDVDNPAAKKDDTPVTGGSITIRFNAEPKTLNPITESSAYQTYVMQYVQDPLAWQNPETFEYEPYIATKWVVEDSVKLRADYPGQERQVKIGDGEPANEGTLEIAANPDNAAEPQPQKLTVVDKAGKPVPKAWIGLTPSDNETETINLWTGEDGTIETVANGKGSYTARVGHELFGKLEESEEGYTLSPVSEANDAEPTTLKKEDVVNVERQTVFTYSLRDDVTWSDGKPFTAKDLEFAFAVVNNPTVDADQLRIYYANIVGVETLDPHTVRIQYSEQYFKAFEITLGLSALAPPFHWFEEQLKKEGKALTLDRLTEADENEKKAISAHGIAFGQYFNRANDYNVAPLGTGPYRVAEWSKPDRRIVLERRKDYWNDEHAGYLDRIIVKFIEDNPTALQAIRAGEIDFFYRVTAEQFFEELEPIPAWLKKDYVKATWYSPNYSYVGWNLRKPFFADQRVRLALAMLFDKSDFFEKKMHGDGVLVSGSQYYFGPGYDRSVGSVGYDPSAARDLLADAGWIDTNGDGVLDKSGQEFRFTALFPPGNPTVDNMMAIMQQEYRSVGIIMEIERMEWAAFVERLQSRNFDMVSLGWASDLESDPYQLWHSSGAVEGNRGSNHVGFANEEADALIEQVRVTLDPEARKRLFFDFHRILDREQPYMFLWTSKDRAVYHQKFRGVKWYALRPGFDLREWWIPKDLQ